MENWLSWKQNSNIYVEQNQEDLRNKQSKKNN